MFWRTTTTVVIHKLSLAWWIFLKTRTESLRETKYERWNRKTDGKKEGEKFLNGVRHAVSRHPHVPLETSCGFHHISSFLWEGEGVNARSANTGRGRAPVRGLVTRQPIRSSGLGFHSQSERGSPTLGCTLMQGPTTTTAREKLPSLPLTDQNSSFNPDPSFLTGNYRISSLYCDLLYGHHTLLSRMPQNYTHN